MADIAYFAYKITRSIVDQIYQGLVWQEEKKHLSIG